VLLISHDRDFLDRLVGSVVVPEGAGRWTEYAGGYTDMLVQRGADLAREQRKSAESKPVREAKTAAEPPTTRKRRLSFNEKHLLETLPKTITSLQAEGRTLQQQLDDPNFYSRDRAAFERTSAALGEVHTKLAAAEDRWIELEILREELSSEE